MSGFFNPDNAFFTFMGKFFDLIVLDLVWLVLYVPFAVFAILFAMTRALIFLIPAIASRIIFVPSMIAMYYAVAKSIIHSRSYPVKEFFRSFKANFKQGAVASVVFLAAGGLLAVDFKYSYDLIVAQDGKGLTYLLVFLVITFFVSGIFIYLCPLLSRFTMDLKSAFKMSFGLTLKHFWCSILSFVLWAAVALLSWLTRGMLLFLVVGIAMVLGAGMMEKVLKKYINKPDENAGNGESGEEGDGPKKDEWYLE